jgi:hypothetical protein
VSTTIVFGSLGTVPFQKLRPKLRHIGNAGYLSNLPLVGGVRVFEDFLLFMHCIPVRERQAKINGRRVRNGP